MAARTPSGESDASGGGISRGSPGPPLTEDELRIVVDELASRLERRKRLEIRGLLLAVLVILGGMYAAFWAMGTWPDHQLGWLLFIPLALGGLIIKASTAWASRSMRQARQIQGQRQ